MRRRKRRGWMVAFSSRVLEEQRGQILDSFERHLASISDRPPVGFYLWSWNGWRYLPEESEQTQDRGWDEIAAEGPIGIGMGVHLRVNDGHLEAHAILIAIPRSLGMLDDTKASSGALMGPAI